jgi:hypothetical protein
MPRICIRAGLKVCSLSRRKTQRHCEFTNAAQMPDTPGLKNHKPVQSLFKNRPSALLWHIFPHLALHFLSILSKDCLQNAPYLRKNLLITNLKNEF